MSSGHMSGWSTWQATGNSVCCHSQKPCLLLQTHCPRPLPPPHPDLKSVQNELLGHWCVSKSRRNSACFSPKWQDGNGGAGPRLKERAQWKLQQMSGIQAVTMPNPPRVINTCMWLWCEGAVGCTRCCAMSAGLAPSSSNQGCGRCAHQLSDRAHASSPCLTINHKPLGANKHVVVKPCTRWWRCPVGLCTERVGCVRLWGEPLGARQGEHMHAKRNGK
jgi:hypothetical protein